ncbi:unnamed protein product [Spirodela intermedia]|uniref:Uncharacterized protein n=1 Tax=Spirodela intermedia TaxID=51605 RepID=A0A7I8KLC4_SPIIN|nr:unnamed protein product [Spirodela intermedia]
MAPASLRIRRRSPLRRPPMNTVGTGGLRPISFASSTCICFPYGDLLEKKVFIEWQRQQKVMLKITTAFCDAKYITRSMELQVIRWKASGLAVPG